MNNDVTYIYGLLCPLTKEVMYVGKSDVPEARILAHLSESAGGLRYPKCLWIRELKKMGLKPGLAIIETCPYDTWKERERHWISYYRSKNPNLKNGNPGANKTRPRGALRRQDKLTSIGVSFNNDEWDMLKELSSAYGVSRQELVRLSLIYINEHRPALTMTRSPQG